MARPKKEEKEKNKYYLSFWFNESQKKILDKYNLDSGEKIRDFIFENFKRKTILITTEKDPNYIKELNKIGVNLNQIARKFNSIGDISNVDIEKINNIIEVLSIKINESDSIK